MRAALLAAVLAVAPARAAEPWACRALHPGPADGLRLVVVPDGQESFDDFIADASTIVVAALGLKEPFASRLDATTVQAVWPAADLCARQDKNHLNSWLKCSHEGLLAAARACEARRYKLVVLSREEFTSYAPVARLRNSVVFVSAPMRFNPESADPQPRADVDVRAARAVFLHELGHAFGLKDEWAPISAKARSPARFPDGPNCAPNRRAARAWWGALVGSAAGGASMGTVGYYEGCAGGRSYIKPTQNSLMGSQDLSLDYGPVNERYLRAVFDACYSAGSAERGADAAFLALYPEYAACAPARPSRAAAGAE